MVDANIEPLISFDNEPNNEDIFSSAKTVWIILNVILVLYAVGLFIYGKYFRKRDMSSCVSFNNI